MKSTFLVVAVQVYCARVNPFRSFRIPKLDQPISLCGNDDSVEAKCALEVNPLAYEASKAVLRVTNDGRPHCTAWLVGDQGHILTNNHCAGTASDSEFLKFEAMAEGDTCETNCKSPLACTGTFIQSNVSFIATGGDTDRDWTLFQLAPEDTRVAVETYGYLKIRLQGSVQGERIYVAGYPRGHGKRLAFMDGSEFGTVLDRNYDTGCGTSELIYKVDTEGGNSGSPVLSYSDHTVVGLHHCGGCSTRGNSVLYFNIGSRCR